MDKQQKPNKNKKPIIILAIVLIVLAGSAAYYWVRSSNYATTEDAQLNGNIYSVRAGVTAYLDKIYFKDNQYVSKGDTLFVFDTTALKAKVHKAKAALEKAKTKLSVSDIQALASRQNAKASLQNILSNKEQIKAAKAKLEKTRNNFNRDKELLKIKAVTQIQYDADKAALAQAKAAYEQAVHEQKSSSITSAKLKSKAKAAHHQISAAAALVVQRKAELKLAKEQLSHAFVTAPAGGIVTKRSVNPGQYVLAGQSLCAVVDEQHIWVTANFKETELHKIEIGQPVKISVDAYPDLEFKGVVQSYGGATGAKFALIPPNNATGNYIKVTQRVPLRIKINDFPAPGNQQSSGNNNLSDTPPLFPGLSVFVKVKTN